MKKRAPGSQLMTQVLWMHSLLNPKLGACKFAPKLSCSWGWVALLAEKFGAGLCCSQLLSLVPGCDQDRAGLLGLLGSGRFCLALGRSCCCPWSATHCQAHCCHQPQRGVGIQLLPGKASLPHGCYLLSPQFWAVVSGQQQRPPHVQLLRSLGNH